MILRCIVALLCASLIATSAYSQETDYTANPNSVLKITIPAPGGGCISGTPPGDATSLIQGCINAAAGAASVPLPCGTWNVTGLTVPAGGLALRGESRTCAILHLTANTAAINCSQISAVVDIRDVTITGTAPAYTGYGTGPTSDQGQRGIHLDRCPNAYIDLVTNNIYGNGFDCENSAFNFNSPIFGRFTLTGQNNFRLFYTHATCEYVTFVNPVGTHNTYGGEVDTGNVAIDNPLLTYNSIGLKLWGSSTNTNPGHGTVSGGSINHNTYDLIAISLGVGETFTGVNLIADQSGGISSGAQGIILYNSRGISFIGGQIGMNAATVQADPQTGDTSLAGTNTIQDATVREDIANFLCPASGYSSSWAIKSNYKLVGQASSCNN